MILGRRIKDALGDRTQAWLSERSGLTQATVSRYIRGTRVPDAYALASIAKALDVSCDWLLGIENKCGETYDIEAVLDGLVVLLDLVNMNQKLAVAQAIDIVRKGGVK